MAKSKYLLGIQSYATASSGASILKVDEKNEILDYVAISEERLIRKKYPYTFPIHSIYYCMNYFNLKSLREIDYLISDWIRIKRWLRSGPAYNYQEFDYIKEILNFDKKKIVQIDHHLAHAASTYYSSGFDKSAILIIDGNGSDLETNSFYLGKNNNIKLIDKSKFYGIGVAYSVVTKNILNFGTGGEGKTMGLAPYGKKNKKIKIPYKLNGIETDFSNFMRRQPHSDVLNHINKNFRPSLIRQNYPTANKKNVTSRKFCDWAFKIQDVAEKVMIHLGKKVFQKTKCKNICLAGGVALNSVANNKLIKNSKFKEIFVFPACSDEGIPFGLVLWGYHNLLKKKKRINFLNAYTGKKYNIKETMNLLNKFNIKYNFCNQKKIANLIKNGKVIGNFSGKSEYGPRALGNRSILADPRNPKMRDHINRKVKHREIFRPFAPAIMEEMSKKYFDISYSPFMLQVAKSKLSKKIPSAIHVDNTARVQTVNKEQNFKFYNLIKEFYRQTGVPVILNTSFNDAGEPLVETPVDAILCFLKTKLDYLVIDDLIIEKKKQKFLKKKIILIEKLRQKTIKENEKNSLKIITKNFSQRKLKKRVKIENIKAQKYVLNRPLKKISQFLRETKYVKKPLLILGTPDHTQVLLKIFGKQIKNAYFYDIGKNDLYEKKIKLSKIKKLKNLNIKNFYKKIFLSTFEYDTETINKFKLKDYFSPYDNSSRSIQDYYYIKEFSGKSKLHSKIINFDRIN